MPSGTSMRQFVDDLRTGKTTVAKAMDDLFGTPQAIQVWKTHPHMDKLRSPSFSTNPLPDWAVEELKGGGSGLVTRPLSDADIAHIDDWPTDQKERMRDKVVAAIDGNRSVQFFWELWDGVQSEIKVHDAGAGDIILTFRTPRSKISVVGQEVVIQVP